MGKAYYDKIQRRDGKESSAEWLEDNGAYYTHASQTVEEVRNFEFIDNQAVVVDIVATEQ